MFYNDPVALPANERERLATLHSFCILDTPPEPCFDNLTALAALLFRVPIAAVSLVDEHRQFFKSVRGFAVTETSREVSFCTHALLTDAPLIVADARQDERFRENPLVVGDTHLRFYAGAPLTTSTGVKLGTFCLLDYKVRTDFTLDEYYELQRFAALASGFIEQRLIPAALQATRQSNAELQRRADQESSASKAKTEFLRTLSHEVRTPMNGVLGMLQLLAGTDLSLEQQHYVEVARSCGGMLMVLLNDVLDLAKIEAGRTLLEALPFHIRRLLDDVAALWRVQAKLKGIAFSLDIAPTVPEAILGDPTRLRQILNNLLSNAVKFTDHGEITVLVERLEMPDGVIVLRFTVRDTGIGITPPQMEGLFEPFVQADSSTTRRFGGSGLGLSLCKRLVDLMGGTLTVTSQVGGGSTFAFAIPFVEAAAQGVATREEIAPFARPITLGKQDHLLAGHDEEARQPSILVVEDNPFNHVVILAQLGKLGFTADVVTSGEQAVAAVQRRDYKVILMDCEMPTMDGYEATRQIRALGATDVYIIALTAHAMSGSRGDCLAAGMNFFLSKPVDLDYLARVLREQCPFVQPLGSEQVAPTAWERPLEEAKEPGFDPDSLLLRLMGDRQLAEVVIRAFIEDCPSQLDILRKRIAANDSPGVRLQAHSLKGAAACVSAPLLCSVALVLETASANEETGRYAELLDSAIEAYADVKSTLEQTGWLPSANLDTLLVGLSR